MTGPLAIVGRHIGDVALLVIEIINGEFPELALDFAPIAGISNLSDTNIEAVIEGRRINVDGGICDKPGTGYWNADYGG